MNMVVSKNYKIKEQNGMYYIVPSSVPGCPQCGGEMKIRDSKRRKVIFADGTVDTFVLRRYKCTGVGVFIWNSRTLWFLISIIRGRRSSIR